MGIKCKKATATQNSPKHWIRKAAQDTQFVTSWVVVAFVVFETVRRYFGDEVLLSLQQWGNSSVFFSAIYSTVPALIAGYGYYWLIENAS
ncbi:putative manganese transporter [Marinomonas arenicola]|uniref:Manganese transporter n=1 Tax=Marinomonas arenicola TaxID=569601 RepID=A0ABU9G6Z4_9GAMM